MDSNFHELPVDRRHLPDSRPQPITIGNDVFIGSGVIILKGVTIGDGCVIAAGSVLFPGFYAASGSTIAGNPAVVVKSAPANSPIADSGSHAQSRLK
jgi:maltose O-acetyltransferase